MNELDVVGVRVEMPNNQPIVLLREVGGDRYLPIWIGPGEATAIAFAQQGMTPARPLTHDLFKDVLEAVGQQLTEVRITDLRDGVFYAELVFASGVEVSALGHGGFHLGSVKRKEDAVRLVQQAVDAGVTFMDNAWEYHEGRSETLMGEGLRGRRDQVFLMTKVCTHGRDRKTAMRQLEQSLRRLRTDHLDLWQIHEVVYENDPELHFAEGGAVEALALLAQGRVDIAIIDGAWVDRFGNVNHSYRGPYSAPTERLPGAGLRTDAASLARRVVLLLDHDDDLPDEVEYLTAPGGGSGAGCPTIRSPWSSPTRWTCPGTPGCSAREPAAS